MEAGATVMINEGRAVPEVQSSLATEKIKILTLNCWGVFVRNLTVAKEFRLQSIGETLKDSDYDIVLLQDALQVWENKDYENLRRVLEARYPYTIYFHNHLFGSGLCIFSRWPLESFITYPYNLNGYPHFAHQADWPAGKAIGYARVLTAQGFKLNLYVTHTHARYAIDHADDFIEGHRLSQAIELMEFVRVTAETADAVFIGGDLNLEPYTTALNLLKRSLNLKDAWLDQIERKPVKDLVALELEGATCEHRANPFSHKAWTEKYGNGLRLDYLLYRPGKTEFSNVRVECSSCRLEMCEIPGAKGLHYSDHAGVVGVFVLTRCAEPVVDEVPSLGSEKSLDRLLAEADGILQLQEERANFYQIYQLAGAVLFLLIAIQIGVNFSFDNIVCRFLVTLLLLVAGAGVFCLFWGNLIGRQCEFSALRNMRNIIKLRIHQRSTAKP